MWLGGVWFSLLYSIPPAVGGIILAGIGGRLGYNSERINSMAGNFWVEGWML